MLPRLFGFFLIFSVLTTFASRAMDNREIGAWEEILEDAKSGQVPSYLQPYMEEFANLLIEPSLICGLDFRKAEKALWVTLYIFYGVAHDNVLYGMERALQREGLYREMQSLRKVIADTTSLPKAVNALKCLANYVCPCAELNTLWQDRWCCGGYAIASAKANVRIAAAEDIDDSTAKYIIGEWAALNHFLPHAPSSFENFFILMEKCSRAGQSVLVAEPFKGLPENSLIFLLPLNKVKEAHEKMCAKAFTFYCGNYDEHSLVYPLNFDALLAIFIRFDQRRH